MIIYNVTIKASWSIHDEWLGWMKEVYIPSVLDTNFFYGYKMMKLLEIDEEDGPTYAVQYFAHSRQDYQRYLGEASLFETVIAAGKWKGKVVSFSTLMEVVN